MYVDQPIFLRINENKWVSRMKTQIVQHLKHYYTIRTQVFAPVQTNKPVAPIKETLQLNSFRKFENIALIFKDWSNVSQSIPQIY